MCEYEYECVRGRGRDDDGYDDDDDGVHDAFVCVLVLCVRVWKE